MAVRSKPLGVSVLDAARTRIRNIFSNGVKVYLTTSGGKDSIVLCDLVYRMCESGEIDKSLLTVQFCDEEIIYDDVVRVCEGWRKRFMMIGVRYEWFCIEHRNNNCFNSLENNENVIFWDRFESANWARPMPSYAIASNKNHVPRVESYQQFFDRNDADGIRICGVRAAESHNRRMYLGTVNTLEGCVALNGMAYPIYDWKDSDVWKYIKDNGVDFPDVYVKMYEAGIPKNSLRVCQLLAIDSCVMLTTMAEAYPEMWEKMLKREPNAYLVRLYWDTEMFARSSKKRRELDADDKTPDWYRHAVMDIIRNPTKYFTNPHTLKMVEGYRKSLVLKMDNCIKADESIWKKMYEGMLGGDTKGRKQRALVSAAVGAYGDAERLENGRPAYTN